METKARQGMKVWVVFMDPFVPIIIGLFHSKAKAERFRVQKLKELGYPKPVDKCPYVFKSEYEVR